jgi:hypothetical protein
VTPGIHEGAGSWAFSFIPDRTDKMSSSEFFVMNAAGQRCDAELHEELLDNLAADAAISSFAIERAIEEDGPTSDMAERLYGLQLNLSLPSSED